MLKNKFEYLYNNFDDEVYKVNLNINYRSANQIISLSEDFIKPQRAIGAKQDAATVITWTIDKTMYGVTYQGFGGEEMTMSPEDISSLVNAIQ